MLEFDGATVTAIRPYVFFGRPAAVLSSRDCQVVPPSVDLKGPLPLGAVGLSPPERKVQPLRRKSHMPANKMFGSLGFIEIIEQPVERFTPLRILFQFLPPSVVLYSPRSSLSLQSFPGTPAAIAAMWPVMVAEPIFLAPRPEPLSESNLGSCAVASRGPAKSITTRDKTMPATKLLFNLSISVESLAMKYEQRLLILRMCSSM